MLLLHCRPARGLQRTDTAEMTAGAFFLAGLYHLVNRFAGPCYLATAATRQHHAVPYAIAAMLLLGKLCQLCSPHHK